MNVAKVAALLRELAAALEEDSPTAANDATPESAPDKPAKARPRARAFPTPLHPVSDTDRMRAMKMLRRRGIA